MIDLNELKKNGHISEGDYVSVKLRQNQIPSDGIIKSICESYIVMGAIETPELEKLKQDLKQAQHNHVIRHVVIDRNDIKYMAVMDKIEEPEKTKNE